MNADEVVYEVECFLFVLVKADTNDLNLVDQHVERLGGLHRLPPIGGRQLVLHLLRALL